MSERDEILKDKENQTPTDQTEQTPKTEEPQQKEEEHQQEEVQQPEQPNTDIQKQVNQITDELMQDEFISNVVNRVNNIAKKIQQTVHTITHVLMSIITFLISPVGLIGEGLLIVLLVVSSALQVYGPNTMTNDKLSTEAPNVDFIKGEERACHRIVFCQ